MSQDKQQNILVRIWLGFWRGLTAFRMAVFNILFLVILALIIRLIISPGEQIVVRDDTTLVIAPNGMIVEQYTGDPVERAINEALGQSVPETRLRDIVAALERAADDGRITQVLLVTDELWGVGPGMQRELAAAFSEFRAAGKPVIAYGGYMSQSQYMFASLADEVWLDREGMVLLEGYGRFRNYYKEGLDKLEVDVNLFRVGEFKSAMEPFIRNDMSEEAKEASRYYLGDLWQDYLEMAAMHRGVPVEVLSDLTENLPDRLEAIDGNAAVLAREAGLVDRLISRPELRSEMIRRGAPDDEGSFRQIAMKTYLKVPGSGRRADGKVGIIVAQGAIMEGRQPPGSIGADSLSQLIRKAVRDDSIKSVVLRVDSPGGSAYASEVIRRELMAVKDAGKPVVISMGNVAASGGYWISMGADEIWAYPNTITGSIGIFGFFPTFQDTLAKIGIHTDGVGTTPLSGAFRADRELGEPMRRLLQSFIENGYEQFINLVADARGMTPEAVDEVARGRVWSGSQAHERGLVDQLGSLDEAAAAAARRAGLGEDFDAVYVEPDRGAFQEFLAEMTGSAVARLDVDTSGMRVNWLPRDLEARLKRDLRLITEASGNDSRRPMVMAHCLCGVDQ